MVGAQEVRVTVLDNKHITQPDEHGYQVRIVRDKKEYSRYFSGRQWGSKRKALEGARNWRDQMLVSLGSVNKYLPGKGAIATKKTTGVRGVSKTVRFDKRRNGTYLSYSVHWRENGKAKTKSFYVGSVKSIDPDKEFHAFLTAVRFRREYELAKANGDAFHPERFKLWRTKRLYEEPFQ